MLAHAADGKEVSAAVGRFGPFVKHGSTYASIKTPESAYTIELPRALQLIEVKVEQIRNRIIMSFDDGAIEVLNGKYGPYITDGARNGRIPKDRDPKTLTREECVEWLAAGKRSRKTASSGAPRKAPAEDREGGCRRGHHADQGRGEGR
jgi:DNA topoisomerase-1